MTYVVGAVLVLVVLAVAAAAASGRLRASSCCSPADPRRDARMRAAYEPDDQR